MPCSVVLNAIGLHTMGACLKFGLAALTNVKDKVSIAVL